MQPNKGGEEKSYKIMILLEVGNVEKRGRSLRKRKPAGQKHGFFANQAKHELKM